MRGLGPGPHRMNMVADCTRSGLSHPETRPRILFWLTFDAAPARSKRRKASLPKCGALLPAETPRLYERPSQSHPTARASPTSTERCQSPLLRLDAVHVRELFPHDSPRQLHHPACCPPHRSFPKHPARHHPRALSNQAPAHPPKTLDSLLSARPTRPPNPRSCLDYEPARCHSDQASCPLLCRRSETPYSLQDGQAAVIAAARFRASHLSRQMVPRHHNLPFHGTHLRILM